MWSYCYIIILNTDGTQIEHKLCSDSPIEAQQINTNWKRIAHWLGEDWPQILWFSHDVTPIEHTLTTNFSIEPRLNAIVCCFWTWLFELNTQWHSWAYALPRHPRISKASLERLRHKAPQGSRQQAIGWVRIFISVVCRCKCSERPRTQNLHTHKWPRKHYKWPWQGVL